MKTYPVPIDLLQEFVRYLHKRPWEEANPFLVAIQKIVVETDQPQQPIQMPKTNGQDDRPVQ